MPRLNTVGMIIQELLNIFSIILKDCGKSDWLSEKVYLEINLM